MNRATTAMEALLADLIGDVANLLDRVESLTTTMDNAREAMNEAKWALAASVEPFQHQMAAAVEQSKAIAVKDIKVRTYEFAVVSMERQKEAMREAARAVISEEVRTPLRQFVASLQGLVDRANQPWRAWLAHIATAMTSAVCSGWFLFHFFGR